MIELFETDRKDINRKSSKVNQLKWQKGDMWYKADYTGYEGLAEYVVSDLLKKSSLCDEEYVTYNQEEIRYNSQIFLGVSCKNFLKAGEQLITLERLFQSTYGKGLNYMVYSTEALEDRLKLIVNKTQEITALEEFGTYMTKLLTIDAFFLNEDRHSHNIAVIRKADGTYRYCPIFDQGASLLADTSMDYPLNEDVYTLMNRVKAKTFCEDFETQLEIAEKLYGNSLRFDFDVKDVDSSLNKVYGYDKAIVDRVRDIIYAQMRKYRYLFM